MATDEIPPRDLPPTEPAGAPAIGNILGLNLLFRERRALVHLARRGLAPGVRVVELEAELPGVLFPLKGALRAARFSRHRAKATRFDLLIEPRAILTWLRQRWIGPLTFSHPSPSRVRLEIDHVGIDARAEPIGLQDPAMCLTVGGHTADGRGWTLIVGMSPRARGRVLELVLERSWLFGEPGVDAAALWPQLMRRLDRDFERDHHAVRVDVGRLALVPAFVAAGWRAPDVSAVSIAAITPTPRGWSLAFRTDESRAARHVPSEPDTVGARLDGVRRALASGARGRAAALDLLDTVARSVTDAPAAALASARWAAEIARSFDATAWIRALRRWLDLQPSAPRPRRDLIVALGLHGEPRELAQLLAAEVRGADDPAARMRLELALATVLVERLGDAATALALVGPMVEALRRARGPRGLLAQALVVQAQARAADVGGRRGRAAPHAIEALDEALDIIRRPGPRAAARARVAQTFLRAGRLEQAMALLTRAIAEDPEELEWVDRAIEVAERMGDVESVIELVDVRMLRSPASERVSLRRRLIDALTASPTKDGERIARARREIELALDVEPDDVDLLRRAIDLERATGRLTAADELTARLLDRVAPTERPALIVERVTALKAAGRKDRAWDALRPLLSQATEFERGWRAEVLALGIDIAPPTERLRLLDDLIACAEGPALGHALVERAAQTLSPGARLSDLRRAVALLPVPGPLIAQIEALSSDDDPQALADLADVARAHDETATEIRLLLRLGRLHLDNDDAARAVGPLTRARQCASGPVDEALSSDALDIDRALVEAYVALARREDARALLFGILDDPRNTARTPDAPQLAERAARLALEDQDTEQATRAWQWLLDNLPRDDPRAQAAALSMFETYASLGAWDAAAELARRRASAGEPTTRAAWLARLARVSPSARRVELLSQAANLAPLDAGIAADLEAEYERLADRDRLGAHLRARLQRVTAPDERRPLLERLTTLARETGREGDEVHSWLEELATLAPDHIDTSVELCRLALGRGDLWTAREAAARVVRASDDDDPRAFLPWLALAQAHLAAQELEEAYDAARHAIALRPGDLAALETCESIARRIDDPERSRRVCLDLLEVVADDPAHRLRVAELHLEIARASARLADFDAVGRHFAATTARLLPETLAHVAIAQEWLQIVRPTGSASMILTALAEQRRALGRNLPLRDLEEEAALSADATGAPTRALDLLADAICTREAPALLISRLQAIAHTHGVEEYALATLVRCAQRIGEGAARDRVAAALATVARRIGRAEAAMLALHHMREAVADQSEHLEVRVWAATELGTLDAARADATTRLRSALTGAREDGTTQAEIQRFARFFAHDPAACAAELLSAAARSELASARLDLARSALTLSLSDGGTPPADASVESATTAALILVQAGRLDPSVWPVIMRHARRVLDRQQTAENSTQPLHTRGDGGSISLRQALAELAVRIAATRPDLVALEIDELIEEALVAAPEDRRSHALLLPPKLAIAAIDTADPTTAFSADAAVVEAIEARVHALVVRQGVNGAHAAMLECAWTRAWSPPIAWPILERAIERSIDVEHKAWLHEELERRGGWASLGALLERRAVTSADEDPDAAALGELIADWKRLGDRAQAAGDLATEARARTQAGLRAFDLGDDATAAGQLARVLEIDEAPPRVRWTLAQALTDLGDTKRAHAICEKLLDAHEHDAIGVPWSELALRVAVARLEDADARGAADLLQQARQRAAEDPVLREAIAEIQLEALLACDDAVHAASVARSQAREQRDVTSELRWIDRAIACRPEHADVELAERAWALDPGNARRFDALMQAVRSEAGEPAAVRRMITQLRKDVAETIADRVAIERLRSGLALLRVNPSPLDDTLHLQREVLARILSLDPDDLDANIEYAELLHSLGALEDAEVAWAQTARRVGSDDDVMLLIATERAKNAIARAELGQARQIVVDGLERRPTEPTLLRLGVAIAEVELDDALMIRCASALLDRTASPEAVARLHSALVDAWARLGDLASLRSACRHAADGWSVAVGMPNLRASLVRRWVGCAERALEALSIAGSTAGSNSEDAVDRWLDQACAARGALRTTLGDELTMAERIAEIDLLLRVPGRGEQALALLERAMTLAPDDVDLRARLVHACRALDLPDRLVAVLRAVAETLEPGEVRSDLARELALAARAAGAARAAEWAVALLPPQIASQEDFLDIHEWALRQLGTVDEEIGAIEETLAREGPEPLQLARLLRLVEQDAVACATRLATLADEARASDELRTAALALLIERAPGAFDLRARLIAARIREASDLAFADEDRAIGVDALVEALEHADPPPSVTPFLTLLDALTVSDALLESGEDFDRRLELSRRVWVAAVVAHPRSEPVLFAYPDAAWSLSADIPEDGSPALDYAVPPRPVGLSAPAARPWAIAHALARIAVASALGPQWLRPALRTTLRRLDADRDPAVETLLRELARPMRAASHPAAWVVEALAMELASRNRVQAALALVTSASTEPQSLLEQIERLASECDGTTLPTTEKAALSRAIADAAQAAGRYERAAESARAVLAIAPDDEASHATLVRALRTLGDEPALVDLLSDRRGLAPQSALEVAEMAAKIGDPRAERLARSALVAALDANLDGLAEAAAEHCWRCAEAAGRTDWQSELATARVAHTDRQVRARWHVRLAEIATEAEARRRELEAARALLPADDSIARALLEVLRQIGDAPATEATLRGLLVRCDEVTARVSILRELLSLVGPDRGDDRIALLEELTESLPEEIDGLIELAALRDASHAGSGMPLLRKASALLREDDPRWASVHSALAERLLAQGDLDAARILIESLAEALAPGEAPPLHLLELQLSLALMAGPPSERIERAGALLDVTPPPRHASLLEIQAAAWFECDRPDHAVRALADAVEASAAREFDTALAERWLSTAIAHADRIPQAAQTQADARRLLRAHGPERWDLATLREELLSWVHSLDRGDDAWRTALEATQRHEASQESLELLVEIADAAGHGGDALAALEGRLRDDPSELTRTRIAMTVIRWSRELDLPSVTLRALALLDPDDALDDPWLSAREWAVRARGEVESERRRVLEDLRKSTRARQVTAHVGRMLRLLDGSLRATLERLLPLTRELAGHEEAGVLAEALFELARREASADPELVLRAAAVMAEFGDLDRLSEAWDDLERRVLGNADKLGLLGLLAAASRASLRSPSSFRHTAEALVDRGLRLLGPEPEVLNAAWTLAELRARLEGAGDDALTAFRTFIRAVVDDLGIRGAALGELWVAAIERAPQESRSSLLQAEARARLDDPGALDVLASALRSLGALETYLDLRLARPLAGDVWIAELEGIAYEARERELNAVEQRARSRLSRELMARGLAAHGLKELQRAFELDPSSDELRLRLGDALAEAGRHGPALELLLPLLDPDSDERLDALGARRAALEARCADLAVAVGDKARGAKLLLRALADEPHGPDRETLAQRAHGLLLEIDARAEALDLCRELVDTTSGSRRAWWLLSLATLEPERASALLREAWALAPESAEIGDRYERALEATGQTETLVELLSERLSSALALHARAIAAREHSSPDLLARNLLADEAQLRAEIGRLGRRLLVFLDARDDAASAADRVALLETMSTVEPDDVEVAQRWAVEMEARGDARARAAWMRVLELRSEAEGLEARRHLLALAIREGSPREVATLAGEALVLAPDDPSILDAYLGAAWEIGDDAAFWSASERRIRQDLDSTTGAVLTARRVRVFTRTPPHEGGDSGHVIETLVHECAEAMRRLGGDGDPSRPDDAAAHRQATSDSAAKDAVDLARAWTELVVLDRARAALGAAAALQSEAQARKALIDHSGETCPPEQIRDYVRLLAGPLERIDEALDVLEDKLVTRLDDGTLLGIFKEIATGARAVRFRSALGRAIDALAPGERRDMLAADLAYAALEAELAEEVLAALDRASRRARFAPALLDLRQWALRQLDRVADELDEVERELVSGPDATSALRLRHLFDDDSRSFAQRVHQLAIRLNDDALRVRLLDVSLDLIVAECGQAPHSATPAPQATSTRAPAMALIGAVAEWLALALPGHSGLPERIWRFVTDALSVTEPVDATASAWARIIELGRALEGSDTAGSRQPAALVRLGLARFPDAAVLHSALLAGVASGDAPHLAQGMLDEIAEEFQLRGYTRARLGIGAVAHLDRPQAASALVTMAQAALAEDIECFSEFVEELEDRSHWAEVTHLLTARAQAALDPAQKVAALKHLAHVHAEILGDDPAATRFLEMALEWAPDDPDLLLPLLDAYYLRRDAGPAIELSRRVLDVVPMGDVAFAALGHRAADAALARGDQKVAEEILRTVVLRVKDDERTRQRLEELDRMAKDPEHRARMLGALASRQTGSARLDALEERARLLLDPLGRLDDAVVDLEVVVAAAPEREGAMAALEGIYEDKGHFAKLAKLLEQRATRTTGGARAIVLTRLGRLVAERLEDPARAEAILRAAWEDAGKDEPRSEILQAWTASLDALGRHTELVEVLEQHLAPRLTDTQRVDNDADIRLLGRLARAARNVPASGDLAARAYEVLERSGHLAEDGLATLARHYRSHHRFDDLLRILLVRCEDLLESGDHDRRAELERRVGELLEGPLRRPHHAAAHYLEAFLVDPAEHAAAGARARILLASTDSVSNVRAALEAKIATLTNDVSRTWAHVLLADILAPQEGYERQAENSYRAALALDATCAAAWDGLGRLLLRQGQPDEAISALTRAVATQRLDPERAGDTAALAGLALRELSRAEEAIGVLEQALIASPEHHKALLELAATFDSLGRADDEAEALGRLARLHMPASLRAEVGYRRARALEAAASEDPWGAAAESARTLLLEAVGADATHAAARTMLATLAAARREWSIVTHMRLLAARDLPPGLERARIHLELAETYLERLRDVEGALRNTASALAQPGLDASPGADAYVRERVAAMLGKVSDRGRAASHLAAAIDGQRLALADVQLDADGRARLLLAAADLWAADDDIGAAERACEQVLAMADAAVHLRQRARDFHELLAGGEFDLRRERERVDAEFAATTDPARRIALAQRAVELSAAGLDEDLREVSRARLQETLEGVLLAPGDAASPPIVDLARRAFRELHAHSEDSARLIAAYEALAARSGTAERSGAILADAARVAFTDRRSVPIAFSLLQRAFAASPRHPDATRVAHELLRKVEDLQVPEQVCEHMTPLGVSGMGVDVAIAVCRIALRGDLRAVADALLDALGSERLDDEQRDAVLVLSDLRATRIGQREARVGLLRERLVLASAGGPPTAHRASDVATVLAALLRELGRIEEAREVVESVLDRTPADLPISSRLALRKLQGDLLERLEEWDALSDNHVALADLETDPEIQARELRRAALVALEHAGDAVNRRNVDERASQWLSRACSLAPHAAAPRMSLIPVAFRSGRWDLVLELTVELRAIAGDDDEELIYGALVEALVHGRRAVARAIGPRHDRDTRARVLLPAFADLADLVAREGPLSRLDAVLGAAAAIMGDTEVMLNEVAQWTAGQGLRPGLALTLGRLHEAFGATSLARSLYQLAAFIAADGPVGLLSTRLPEPELPRDPLQHDQWVPMAWRGALRETLMMLREYLAGIRGRGGETAAPETAVERAAFAAAATLVSRYRERVGCQAAVVLTHDPLHAAVGVRNRAEPQILVNPAILEVSEAEREFRVAVAVVAIATGLGPMTDTHPLSVTDVLGAMSMIARPDRPVPTEGARIIADALAARGLRPAMLPATLRQQLARELEHWLDRPTGPDQLIALVRRATLLAACRLSGRVDGALTALARDLALLDSAGRPLSREVLASDEARWLLGQLGLNP